MKFTVFGSTGFIGRNLVSYLIQQKADFFLPGRSTTIDSNENLGHIIYCIGLTSDFRKYPLETVEAHVCKLKSILSNHKFESFTYLSSSRVYSGSQCGSEGTELLVNPNNFSDLYNISKLMGESICLSNPDINIRVARLSNVIGTDLESGNFLSSLIKDALSKGKIELQTSLENAKDYIHITDVVQLLYDISSKGKDRIYNVASGIKTSNKALIAIIRNYTNCEVKVTPSGDVIEFPDINIKKIEEEFNFRPQEITDILPEIIEQFKNEIYDSN